jgi:hypothetical protein
MTQDGGLSFYSETDWQVSVKLHHRAGIFPQRGFDQSVSKLQHADLPGTANSITPIHVFCAIIVVVLQ